MESFTLPCPEVRKRSKRRNVVFLYGPIKCLIKVIIIVWVRVLIGVGARRDVALVMGCGVGHGVWRTSLIRDVAHRGVL